MITKEKISFLAVDMIFLAIYPFLSESNTAVFCIAMADIMVFLVIALQIKKGFSDVLLFFFNVTYFLFVLGGGTATMMSGIVIQEYAGGTLQDTNTACLISFVGIAVTNTFYALINGVNVRLVIDGREGHSKVSKQPTNLQLLAVCVAFFGTAGCKLLMALETFMYSQDYGYVALYTKETSSLPSALRYAGALFYLSLMLFLACDFSKKVTFFGYGVVLGIEALILSAGDRGEAVCGFLILVVHTINKVKEDESFFKHWKKALAGLVALIPFGIYFLQRLKYTRVDKEMALGFGDAITEFFSSQGVSLQVVTMTINLQEKIEKLVSGKGYVFGHVIEYLQQNVISRTIFGFEKINGNTVEAAMSAGSLGSTLSFLRFRESYLSGIGCGSCYLAELFNDYSWVGLVIGSMFISVLLMKLNKVKISSWIGYALVLNFTRVIFLTPRGSYFRWLTDVFSFPNVLLLSAILFVGIISRPYKRKSEEIV